jgi:hypothetical protein
LKFILTIFDNIILKCLSSLDCYNYIKMIYNTTYLCLDLLLLFLWRNGPPALCNLPECDGGGLSSLPFVCDVFALFRLFCESGLDGSRSPDYIKNDCYRY